MLMSTQMFCDSVCFKKTVLWTQPMSAPSLVSSDAMSVVTILFPPLPFSLELTLIRLASHHFTENSSCQGISHLHIGNQILWLFPGYCLTCLASSTVDCSFLETCVGSGAPLSRFSVFVVVYQHSLLAFFVDSSSFPQTLITGVPLGLVLRTFLFFSFIFISWRLITLQYCSGFCHTLTWISHGFTCVPHPDPPSHLRPHLLQQTNG